MQGYCSVVNLKDNMVRMEAEILLSALCADISAIEQANTAKKNSVDNRLLLSKSPDDLLKIHKYDCR